MSAAPSPDYCMRAAELGHERLRASHWSLYLPVAPAPRQARVEKLLSIWMASVLRGGFSYRVRASPG